MRESIKNLLEGVTLIVLVEENKETIVELSFYDKQHGIDSDYPCINTCITDEDGKEWFTETYLSWGEFIHDIKVDIAYYEAKSQQNLDNIYYINECEFL